MSVVNVTEANFETEVLKSAQPVMVDFWATWCGPCKMLAPVVDAVAEKYDGKVKICKLDVDQAMSIAGQYKISSVPTLIFFKGGAVVAQTSGVQSEDALCAKLDELLK